MNRLSFTTFIVSQSTQWIPDNTDTEALRAVSWQNHTHPSLEGRAEVKRLYGDTLCSAAFPLERGNTRTPSSLERRLLELLLYSRQPTHRQATGLFLQLIYLVERQTRIDQNDLLSYGFLHVAAHAAEALLFGSSLPIMGSAFNRDVHVFIETVRTYNISCRSGPETTPVHIRCSPILLPAFDKKVQKNIDNAVLCLHMLAKMGYDLCGMIDATIYDWSHIRRLCRVLATQLRGSNTDLTVVGILSGGGFIAPLLREALGSTVPVCFIRPTSGGWSGNTPVSGALQHLTHQFTDNVSSVTFEFVGPYTIQTRRVLIVDDTVLTGSTLRNALDFLRLRVDDVQTCSLFVSTDTNYVPDYYVHQKSTLPIVWPWGYETR
jgi:hypoxanthine phosphoribosyltransferase